MKLLYLTNTTINKFSERKTIIILLPIMISLNICLDGYFEHSKHMLKIMGKKIFTFLHCKFCLYLNLWWSVFKLRNRFHMLCFFIL